MFSMRIPVHFDNLIYLWLSANRWNTRFRKMEMNSSVAIRTFAMRLTIKVRSKNPNWNCSDFPPHVQCPKRKNAWMDRRRSTYRNTRIYCRWLLEKSLHTMMLHMTRYDICNEISKKKKSEFQHLNSIIYYENIILK